MNTVLRLMLTMHHNGWAIAVVAIGGIIMFVLGSRIQYTTGRTIILGVAVILVAFVMATGVIAPLDDWQHQHGECLLDSLEKKNKP